MIVLAERILRTTIAGAGILWRNVIAPFAPWGRRGWDRAAIALRACPS